MVYYINYLDLYYSFISIFYVSLGCMNVLMSRSSSIFIDIVEFIGASQPG